MDAKRLFDTNTIHEIERRCSGNSEYADFRRCILGRFIGFDEYEPNEALQQQLEKLWIGFSDIAPKDFKNKLFFDRRSFYQRWWEMYCGVGLFDLGLCPNTSYHEKGPDFHFVYNEKKYYVECVAPGVGDADKPDSLKIPKLTNKPQVFDLPELQFLLRLSTGIDEKREKFLSYIEDGTVARDDILIIAISSCYLGQFGFSMNFPVSAIDKILFGIGDMAINIETGEKSLTRRHNLIKQNGKEIDVGLFEKDNYHHISGVIYSFDDPINPHTSPKENLFISINHNAENTIQKDFYELFSSASM